MSINNPTHQLHLLIQGSVQGVFFRTNTRRKASELGLTGWVKNLPDGQVECLVQGEKENLQNLLKWCWSSPGYSDVRDIQSTWQEPAEIFSMFRIVH